MGVALVGFLVAVLGAACSLPVARDWMKSLFDPQNADQASREATRRKVERRMDTAKFFLVVIGVAVGTIAYDRSRSEKADDRARIAAEAEARKSLRREIGGRDLTEAELDHLDRIAKRLTGRSIRFGFVTDPEVQRYAEKIAQVLARNGVTVVPIPLGTIVPAQFGVHCGTSDIGTAMAEVIPGCGPVADERVRLQTDFAIMLKPQLP